MAKNKSKAEDSETADIRVLMTALNLILLVFFVYINTIGENDETRVKKALDSLTGTFSILPGGLDLTPGREISEPGIPIIERPPVSRSIFSRMKMIKFKLGIREAVEGYDLGRTVEVSLDGKDLIIHLADLILFSSGSADLHLGARSTLEKVAEIIREIDVPIRVEGHTDDLPISNDRFESNWDLSASRAVSIVRYLVEKSNVSGERLSAVGYGEFQPLVPNESSDQRAMNRRVSIILLGAGRG